MKRFIAATVVLAVALGAFVSCAKKPEAPKEPLKLELYYYKQEIQEGMQKLVDAFTAENPDVAISLLIVPNDADATMSARAASGTLPEILQMQSYSRVVEYAQKGYLVDMSSEPILAQVLDDSKAAVSYNGKQWAVPMDFAGIGIIYNKKIFADLGLEAPATYRDLERVCQALKAKGIIPFAGLLKENWSVGHFITLVHTSLLAEKGISVGQFIADRNAGTTSYGVVDQKKLFAALDFYRANMAKNAEEMAWNEQVAAFAEGKSAMMVQGLWSYGAALSAKPDLDCGFIPFPVFNDAAMNKFYADVDSCFGVSAQAAPEKRAAALRFVTWLSSPAAVKIWTESCKLTSSFKGADMTALQAPFGELMAGVAKNGAYPWAFSMYPTAAFEDGCKNGAQQYMMKKKNAAAVIADIDRIWTEALKK